MKNKIYYLILSILIWCFIIVMLLTFYYPREMKRVAGPEKMVAILKYEPAAQTGLLPIFLLPILGVHNNCYVFVRVERWGRQINNIDVGYGNSPKNFEDSQIIWTEKELIIIDEHHGHTNKWNFESTISYIKKYSK